MRKGFFIPAVVFGVAVLFVVGAWIVYSFKTNSKINSSSVNLTSKQFPSIQINNQEKSMKYKTFQLFQPETKDLDTNIYFYDLNKIYQFNLSGSAPVEIATMSSNVSTIVSIDKKLLIATEGARANNFNYWILNDGQVKPEKIDSSEYQRQYEMYANAKSEIVFTKELSSGKADILADLGGNTPIVIGSLSNKQINVGCEMGPCPGPKFPGKFYPSFDGSYLLSEPPGGGGLGESALVYSRDGSRVYKIGFYWYVSSAIWVGNNTLLIKPQGGTEKLIVFKDSGIFDESKLPISLNGLFNQSFLSPSKKFLITTDTENIYVYDLEKNTEVLVDKGRDESLYSKFNISNDSIISQDFNIKGWNKNSNKILYSVITRVTYNDHHNDRILQKEIRLFDIPTSKIFTLAIFNSSDPLKAIVNYVLPNFTISRY